MSLNVCSDDIFWIVTYFVTKLGMVVQHHKPECHAEKKCLLSTRSRSQRGLICSKYYSFYYIFCIADSLATNRGLMVHHHKLECLGKKLITVFKVKVTGKVQNVNECLSRWYLLNATHFVTKLVMVKHYNESECWCKKIGLLSSRSRSHQGLIWSKCDSFYYIFWTADPFATKFCFVVLYLKPESVLWRNWTAVLEVKVTAELQNINECLSRQYLLNSWSFYYQTWCRNALSWARVSFKKDLFAVFKVKITVKDHIIKIWLSNTSS